MLYPIFKKIPYRDPLEVFASFADQHAAILLDSADIRSESGRYSFIAIDPFLTLSSKNGVITLNQQTFLNDPWQVLTDQLANYRCPFHPQLPPFQGGAAGFFSYDLYQHLEDIALHPIDDMQFPDLALGFYDLVIAFDLISKEAWIISNGFLLQKKQCAEHANIRLEWLDNQLNKKCVFPTFSMKGISEQSIEKNFSKIDYEMAVKQVRDFILTGDIFEANISQRFKATLSSSFSAFDLYQRLRKLNPAPFAAFMRFNHTVLASASPERFLKLSQKQVESRPIKGTRPRSVDKNKDQQLADDLLKSEKDRAENVMIVDLLRNDLSRVCEPGSVKVSQLCGLESYASVHHLVSVVQGKLADSFNAVDLLRATFPGGSITGAPKIRAMEIITEIEKNARGPYCGSMGYIGFNGDMDLSILIRTFAIKNNQLTFQAGGAVTLDSDPTQEYEETLVKAHRLKEALIHDFVD